MEALEIQIDLFLTLRRLSWCWQHGSCRETQPILRTSQKAWGFVDRLGRWDGLRKRYGKDKTFVVPIMTNCAIAGLIDWKQIPTLPFEAAALPQSWYRFAKMPVVSYAVPALVAIGQAQFVHNPPKNPIAHVARRLSQRRTLRVLQSMQPESGGYLEATPLTSFVLMSLASIGQANSPVCQSAIRFLRRLDVLGGKLANRYHLATWVTSLTTTNYYSALLENEPQASHPRPDSILINQVHRSRFHASAK